MPNEQTLTYISDDIWYTDFTFKKFPAVFATRMVVVRLPGDGLWLHSPVPIGDKLYQQVNETGEVEFIIAPNLYHHLFVHEAKSRYPNAMLWGTPGLPQKRADIRFDAVFNEQQPEWGDTIEFHFVRGMPRVNEVVFFHKLSKTLICSDFVFNIQKEENFLMKLLWKLVGTYKKFGQSRVWRSRVSNVFDHVDSVNKILKWEFERIVMAHGDIIQCNNSQLFEAISKGNKNFYVET